MIRPEHLQAIGERDRLERLPPGTGGGKRLVAGRVPILSQHNVPKLFGEAIDERHPLIAALDRKGAAGTKIILDVDHEKRVPTGDCVLVRHDRAISCRVSRRSTSSVRLRRAAAISTG